MRKWRYNGEKEKTWRGRKSLSFHFSPFLHFLILSPFSLSLHFLILSPFPFHFLVRSPFPLNFLAIFSEAASQLPAGCASLSWAEYKLVKRRMKFLKDGTHLFKQLIKFMSGDSPVESHRIAEENSLAYIFFTKVSFIEKIKQNNTSLFVFTKLTSKW